MSNWEDVGGGKAYHKQVGRFHASLWPFAGVWRMRLAGEQETVFECTEGELAHEADKILKKLLGEMLSAVEDQ